MTQQRSMFLRAGVPTALRADFEAFWQAYPPRRPNPRALAEAAFQQAVRAGTPASDLVAAAGAYAAEVKRKGIGEDFVVHARTFLAQRRFLDYLPAPGAAAAPAVAEAEPDHELWPLLRGTVSRADFLRWIAPLQVVSRSEGDAALLQAPTRFVRDWVRQHFGLQIRSALRVRVLDIEIAEDIEA